MIIPAVAVAIAATAALLPSAARAQLADAPLSNPGADAARFHATLEAARLHALLDADWDRRMHDDPEYASQLGDHRFDDKLTDASPAAVAQRDAQDRALLAALNKIDRDAIAGEDRISLDVALHKARIAVEFQRYPALHTRVLSANDGLQINLPTLMTDTPVRNELDARHALARLHAMPVRIAQDIAWLREGKRLGWVTFKSSLSQVPDQIDGLIGRPLAESPLVHPFATLPPDIPPARRQALLDQATATLRDEVIPAFLDLRKVVVDELLPVSPDNGAMSSYPDGDAIYRLKMREQTTLTLDASAVNALGLSEVARIHARIADVMRELGFKGSYAEFVNAMNHDPKYFYTSGDELLAGYRDIAKRVDPELPRLFLVLPRAPYGVRAIPAFQGKSAGEFYTGGAADGSTPGWFNANVIALAQRPKWAMEDLFLHEGVPGHHLQIARAYELVQLPAFRRAEGPTAYLEGWALYCESLGGELGLYTTPESRYGQLQAEDLRAARLVVDTGLHALGWTRARAIAYLVDEVATTPEDAQEEIDRYIVDPAQALGYKLGQLKIQALRQKARDELGARFDLRAFHQEVLDHGALPLPVLEQVITDWIARVKANPLVPLRTGL